jgi:predicted ATPase
MEITRFIGKGVRGHFDFDIPFRKGVNFLIGDNGSGKTSVLRLIKGMLMPSLEDLADIEYSIVSIELEDNGKKTTVSSTKKEKNRIYLEILPYNEEPIHDTFPIEKVRRTNGVGVSRRPNSVVIDYIQNMLSALFIGTDRVADKIAFDIDFDGRYIRTAPEFNPRVIYNRMVSSKMSFNTVDIALMEVRERLYFIIRRNARTQEVLITKFKNSLLSVLFKVFPISDDQNFDFNKELEQLKRKRKRLEDIFIEKSIGDNFSDILNNFFNQAEMYLNILNESPKDSKEYKDAKNNWIANINPNRINEIINLADNYTKNMDELRRPIGLFINSANKFFNGSPEENNKVNELTSVENNNKKIVSVDGSGEITIRFNDQDNKTNSIFELSSGEKQLIILLGHLAFDNTNVFVIDEPELSLHISWQEIFADELKKVNPNCQYIMATHAPAIVEKNEKCCINLNAK